MATRVISINNYHLWSNLSWARISLRYHNHCAGIVQGLCRVGFIPFLWPMNEVRLRELSSMHGITRPISESDPMRVGSKEVL